MAEHHRATPFAYALVPPSDGQSILVLGKIWRVFTGIFKITYFEKNEHIFEKRTLLLRSQYIFRWEKFFKKCQRLGCILKAHMDNSIIWIVSIFLNKIMKKSVVALKLSANFLNRLKIGSLIFLAVKRYKKSIFFYFNEMADSLLILDK